MPLTTDLPVLIGVEGQIATLTLNRPAKLNAIDYATIDALQRHLDAIERDENIRVVILTGVLLALAAICVLRVKPQS